MSELISQALPLNLVQAPTKTVTFTGLANFGLAAGNTPIHIWTVSGTVVIPYTFGLVLVSLTGVNGILELGTADDNEACWTQLTVAQAVAGTKIVNGVVLVGTNGSGILTPFTLNHIAAYIDTADITGGQMTFDAWYIPVTPGASLSLAFAGVAQVNTATVAETVEGVLTAGDVAVIVTAAGMAGSPITIQVAAATNDSSATVAGKIRTALAADATIGAFFIVSGATTAVVLTVTSILANDATMNIDIADGTSVGIVTAHTSTKTTDGQPVV